MLDAGDLAPNVTLHTGDGGTMELASLRGHILILYFYPKDDTSGCTTEAKDFSERKAAFELEGAYVLGVSKNTSAEHAKFVAKHALTIPLATDADGSVCDAFGTWGEKSLYGRKYMGIDRATFLIDPEGRIARVWRKVKVPGHAEAVLEAARELKGARQG